MTALFVVLGVLCGLILSLNMNFILTLLALIVGTIFARNAGHDDQGDGAVLNTALYIICLWIAFFLAPLIESVESIDFLTIQQHVIDFILK